MSLASRLGSALDAGLTLLDDPAELGRALDQAAAIVSPQWGARRAAARLAFSSAYDGAKPSGYRKFHMNGQDGTQLAQASAMPIREQARHLQRNHDLARGILRTMANFTVGAQGIQVEPQPRTLGDEREINIDLADEIDELWLEWCRKPEVTWQLSFAQCQRLAFSSMVRDGEMFSQMLEGFIPSLNHGTEVPFSIEMMEADLVPLHFDDLGRGIQQGIERNEWGRARAFHVYRRHPGGSYSISPGDTKRIEAYRMLHPKLIDRIGQLRGMSEFASIITRLEDIKDYEESERIAAKIGASMAAVIKKGEPSMWDSSFALNEDGTRQSPRQLRFRPGMIFDDLMPGEDVSMIDSKRPNSGLGDFIQEMTRRIAGGTGTGYSSISKNYAGSYSSQRQELVESWTNYSCLAEHFASQFVQPIYVRFINTAVMSGRLRIPDNIDPMSLDDAIYQAPAMPWIDPGKEAKANETLEKSLQESGPEIIRRRGRNPRRVLRQARWWREQTKDLRSPALPAIETNQPEQDDATTD